MARPKLQMSLADYVAIAVGPVLIMLLVGSLAFFLLHVGHAGRYEARLHWVLFWFVLAIVLIARIAIEQGSHYAGLYGLAMAGATSLVLFRLVESPWTGIGVLGVIWWCAHKLTWDCTLIDDSQDASGEGLLQAAGLDEKTDPPPQPRAEPEPPRGLHGLEHRPDAAGRPHSPGLWVVWFSLAALPLFGLGQLLIPAHDAAGRRWAFLLLWVYVASGLGLLLTTSFLGLRRYLRQRKLRMPATMAATWIGLGAVLGLAILLGCLLVPRPEADYSATALLGRLESRAQQASRFAAHRQEPGEGEGRRIGDPQDGDPADEEDEDGEGRQGAEGREPGQDGGRSNENGDAKQGGKGRRRGDEDGDRSQQGDQQDRRGDPQQDRQDERQDDRQRDRADGRGDEQPGGEGPDEEQDRSDAGRGGGGRDFSPPSLPLHEAAGWLARLGRWIIYALIALLAVYLLIRSGPQLLGGLKQLWGDLRKLWARLSGAPDDPARAEAGDASEPRRPFALFADPFASGTAHQMPPAELVRYTFEALEAWAAEHGDRRRDEQTPLEFADHLAAQQPALSDDVRQTARLYARVAYAGFVPGPAQFGPLERLWRRMRHAVGRTSNRSERRPA